MFRDEERSPKALVERLQLSGTHFPDYRDREAKAASPAGTKVTANKGQRSHAAVTRKTEEPGSPSSICLAEACTKACPSRDGEAGREG